MWTKLTDHPAPAWQPIALTQPRTTNPPTKIITTQLISYLIIFSLILFKEIMSPILHSDLKKPISSKHLSEWLRGKVCDINENNIPLRDISY